MNKKKNNLGTHRNNKTVLRDAVAEAILDGKAIAPLLAARHRTTLRGLAERFRLVREWATYRWVESSESRDAAMRYIKAPGPYVVHKPKIVRTEPVSALFARPPRDQLAHMAAVSLAQRRVSA